MRQAVRNTALPESVSGLPRLQLHDAYELLPAMRDLRRDPEGSCIKVLEDYAYDFYRTVPKSMMMVEYKSKPDRPHSGGVFRNHVSPRVLLEDFEVMVDLHSKVPHLAVEPHAMVNLAGIDAAILMQRVEGETLLQAFNATYLDNASLKMVLRAVQRGINEIMESGAHHLDIHAANIMYRIEEDHEGRESVRVTFIDPQPESRRFSGADRGAFADLPNTFLIRKNMPAVRNSVYEVMKEARSAEQLRLLDIPPDGVPKIREFLYAYL